MLNGVYQMLREALDTGRIFIIRVMVRSLENNNSKITPLFCQWMY